MSTKDAVRYLALQKISFLDFVTLRWVRVAYRLWRGAR